jgi:broad specificity phosphatase PhoE
MSRETSNIYIVRHLDRIDEDDCDIESSRKWNGIDRLQYINKINPYICKTNNKLNKIIVNLNATEPTIDYIICSPFLRCIETAILIKNNYANILDKTINIDFNLSEFIVRYYGFTIPINISEVYEHSKSYLTSNYSDYLLNELNTELSFDKYETDEEYTERINKVMTDIKLKYSGKNVLVVTHKDALNLNMRYGEVYKLNEDLTFSGGYYNEYIKSKSEYLSLKTIEDLHP